MDSPSQLHIFFLQQMANYITISNMATTILFAAPENNITSSPSPRPFNFPNIKYMKNMDPAETWYHYLDNQISLYIASYWKTIISLNNYFAS